jgi:hypothetical protein
MGRVIVRREVEVRETFRVAQTAGMFDLPVAEVAKQELTGEFPELDEPWVVGLVTGPSGAGKSTLVEAWRGGAEAAWGRAWRWPDDEGVIEAFDAIGARGGAELLVLTGLGSAGTWVRPYETLSNGERFRAELARRLMDGVLEWERTTGRRWSGREGAGKAEEEGDEAGVVMTRPVVAIDEFTSTIDRDTARSAAAAVGRAIRAGRVPVRLVAVTCHEDVREWLAPEWTLEVAGGRLERGWLPGPCIELGIRRVRWREWARFERHHYLAGGLSKTAHCYVSYWGERPVTFVALAPAIGRKGVWRMLRVVTLPEHQGLGAGMRTAERVAELYVQMGVRVTLTAAHPGMTGHCRRSARWRAVRVAPWGSAATGRFHAYRGSAGRAVASFEFVPEVAGAEMSEEG